MSDIVRDKARPRAGNGASRPDGGRPAAAEAVPGPAVDAPDPAGGAGRVTDEALRLAVRAAAEVVELVRDSAIRRIQVTVADVRIEVEGAEAAPVREAVVTVSGGAVSGAAAVAAVPGAAVAAVAGAVANPVGTVAVPAPLMGVFFRAPGPDQPPFVQLGQRVDAGDQVAIVEAMKMMNPVVADRAGIVRAIHAVDGEVVEYDQPLLSVEPC
ncbi:acetyl-CoA carboxylase biotin carboxyl carrier protein [Plantactinospora soyae]|uniref:Biotin carboxyl carrier protein of acetyl-CoA carboxylase n=1 Tax=Plantactinospora soyae TaxID=1544732 RepID=A0A927MCL4_9ACTN|nr:biotin/lipoyl-containing protein [Plantactinospora soyae]MBE1491994.1 acetyl-CoA carboxylase biotin carboxyl carrier protein [Plantactinospora soyae]